nr:Chain A, AF.2A1 [synthetic construct]
GVVRQWSGYDPRTGTWRSSIAYGGG